MHVDSQKKKTPSLNSRILTTLGLYVMSYATERKLNPLEAALQIPPSNELI